MKSVKSNLLVLMLILNAATSLAGNGDVESASRQAKKLVGYSCEAIPKTLVQNLFRSGEYASTNMEYLEASQNLRVTILDTESMGSGDGAAMALRMTTPSIAPYIGNMSINGDVSTQMVMRNLSPQLIQNNFKNAKPLGKRNGYYEFLLGNQSDLELYKNSQLFKILDSTTEDAGTKEQFLKAFSLPKSAIPTSFASINSATRNIADVSLAKSGDRITYEDDEGRDRVLATIEPQSFVAAENEYFSVSCHLLNIRPQAVEFVVKSKRHKIVDRDMVPFWGEFLATKGVMKVKELKIFFEGRESSL